MPLLYERVFPIRADEAEERPTPPPPAMPRITRARRERVTWVLACAHGAFACDRCGATRSMLPLGHEVIDDYLRELRAFVRLHARCSPKALRPTERGSHGKGG